MVLAGRFIGIFLVPAAFFWIIGCGSDTSEDPCAADDICNFHGSCNDSTGVALCTCDPGYAGDRCERCDYGYLDNGQGECVPPNPCLQFDCTSQNRKCENIQGQAVCTECLSGYHEEGAECVEDTNCQSTSCNGHGECDDSGGAVVCTCDPGYRGDHCDQCAEGYYDNGLGDCVTSDPCNDAGCEIQHRECENQQGTAVCTDCLPGFHEEGGFCVEDVNCQPDSCNGHGQCRDDTGDVVCTCDQGYTGDHCEECAEGYTPWPENGDTCVDDPCLPDPCELPNTQQDACQQTGADQFVCLCLDGYDWDGFACLELCNDPDGDGYGVGAACLGVDCDESDTSINEGATEICDDVDNDCDDLTDEDDPGGGAVCDTGELGPCAPGHEHCVDGQVVCVRDTEPTQEICDGQDNNCDGDEDEGDPGGGDACDTGELGVCAAGTWHCQDEQLVCVRDTEPTQEICDGYDNNCDGDEDEGDPGGGAACDTGEDGVCAPGHEHCTDGQITCVRDVEPSQEICDGYDNNCDGTPDDGNPGGGQPCDTGLVGVCAVGTTECQSPTLVCNQTTTGEPEICGDTLDNDCDGVTDNGCCTDIIQDGGLEAGTPNSYWTEASTNFGTPICDDASCGDNPDLLPYAGTYWAWFGGISDVQEIGSLSQEITIPAGNDTTLMFQFNIPACDDAGDVFEVRIDGEAVFSADATDPRCDTNAYELQSVDISVYADGNTHTIEFWSEINSTTDVTNFFVDDIVVESCIPD